jgi:superfamily II DNA or RNA helicase
MKYKLRPYQIDIVEKLRHSYRTGHHAPLLQAPTGSGKTVIFAYITEAAAKLGNSVLILVHRQELLNQTSRALFDIGVPHGLIAPGRTSSHEQVQVASVQTLVRRLGKYPKQSLIVIDECAHAVASSWVKILNYYSDSRLLGVTATPARLDNRGLGVHVGGFFDDLVNGPTPKELIQAGYLSRPVVYAPQSGLDMTGIHKRFGDYVTSEMSDIMDKPKITGCAVTQYNKICPGVPAIAFCASVKHAEHTAEQFNNAGIPATSIDGKMSDAERLDCINGLGNGKYLLLASCEIVSEGTDIPIVTAAIMLRPTASTSLYLQQAGRCLRPHPSKTESYILDHVGNVFRHGLPDDDREWSLDGGCETTKKDAEKNPYIQCESCYFVFMKTEKCCPKCGYERPIQSREIEQVDGDLVKLQEEEKRRFRINKRREIGQAKTLEALEGIERQRGYKRGWAYHVYNARKNKQYA